MKFRNAFREIRECTCTCSCSSQSANKFQECVVYWTHTKKEKKTHQANTYNTRGAIYARLVGAVVPLDLTVGSGVPFRTAAGVASLAGVCASSTILARLVIGAIIEILIAKQSAPALVAVALPRLVASTMGTSGVPDALVTGLSLPTHSTSATNSKSSDKGVNTLHA